MDVHVAPDPALAAAVLGEVDPVELVVSDGQAVQNRGRRVAHQLADDWAVVASSSWRWATRGFTGSGAAGTWAPRRTRTSSASRVIRASSAYV